MTTRLQQCSEADRAHMSYLHLQNSKSSKKILDQVDTLKKKINGKLNFFGVNCICSIIFAPIHVGLFSSYLDKITLDN